MSDALVLLVVVCVLMGFGLLGSLLCWLAGLAWRWWQRRRDGRARFFYLLSNREVDFQADRERFNAIRQRVMEGGLLR